MPAATRTRKRKSRGRGSLPPLEHYLATISRRISRVLAVVGILRVQDANGRPSISGEAPVKLIVGLGNPGERYEDTRHNAGFLVLDILAERHGLRFREGRLSRTCRWGNVTLIKPTTFMNGSGKAVQAAAASQRVRPQQIVLVHDDLDLPLGRLRIKQGGGAGGQRGVKDTIDRIGPDFWRLKVGISRPPEGWRVESWVLSRFREEERELRDRVLNAAADSLESLLEQGPEAAMNGTNGIDLNSTAA